MQKPPFRRKSNHVTGAEDDGNQDRMDRTEPGWKTGLNKSTGTHIHDLLDNKTIWHWTAHTRKLK